MGIGGAREESCDVEPAAVPSPPGALGELVLRFEQARAAETEPPPSPPVPEAETLDVVEHALTELLRREAERHGLTGWTG